MSFSGCRNNYGCRNVCGPDPCCPPPAMIVRSLKYSCCPQPPPRKEGAFCKLPCCNPSPPYSIILKPYQDRSICNSFVMPPAICFQDSCDRPCGLRSCQGPKPIILNVSCPSCNFPPPCKPDPCVAGAVAPPCCPRPCCPALTGPRISYPPSSAPQCPQQQPCGQRRQEYCCPKPCCPREPDVSCFVSVKPCPPRCCPSSMAGSCC